MRSSAPPESACVAVFAKAPVAGEVKTRLAAVLGPEGAAGLHAGLVRHALATAVESGVGPVQLWCAPDASHDFFERCGREFGAALRTQSGADLGARMRTAFEAALANGEALLLIGSDCPALGARELRGAREALRESDAVLIPAEDGGYVLVGLARAVPGLFDGIAWGGSAVMAETRNRLRAANARWTELAPLWDVDRPEDYARLQREGLLQEVLS